MAQRKVAPRKLSAKEKLRREERRRHKQYRKRVGKHVVFGKKVRSRMIRVAVKYADNLSRKAKAKGLSLPEYTAKLVK
jgi:hypothetical protein